MNVMRERQKSGRISSDDASRQNEKREFTSDFRIQKTTIVFLTDG